MNPTTHFRNEEEQALSADWSSLINKAYKTLQSPINRGEYLLELNDVVIPEGNTAMNKEFLLEMMERNEEVSFFLCIEISISQVPEHAFVMKLWYLNYFLFCSYL